MANPNQQQNEQQQPQRKNVAANDDVELNPIDLQDEPLPVIKSNAEGEGDDAAAGFQGDEAANLAGEEYEGDENEGEGNKTADQNYRRGVKKTVERGNVEQDAKKAADALDDEDERQELEDAEEAGRKGRTIH
jgi:hypothetical protein